MRTRLRSLQGQAIRKVGVEGTEVGTRKAAFAEYHVNHIWFCRACVGVVCARVEASPCTTSTFRQNLRAGSPIYRIRYTSAENF